MKLEENLTGDLSLFGDRGNDQDESTSFLSGIQTNDWLDTVAIRD